MNEHTQKLCRTVGVIATYRSFAVFSDGFCSARRTYFRHSVRNCVGNMLFYRYDLRYDVSGFAYNYCIAYANAFSLMKSSLWSVALLTVDPAISTGENTAVGVRTPVLPTFTSMLNSFVSFSSGGYLKAMAHFGNLAVLPRIFRFSKSFTFITAPSMSKGRV